MPVPVEVLRDMQEVGRDLYRLGLVTSHGGNLSVRRGNDIWITGTGRMLGRLQPEDISLARMDGSHEGPLPSSDTLLHSTIYAVTTVNAIVHAHPRHAIALSFDAQSIVPEDYEGRLHLKEVPVIEMGPLQEQQMASALGNSLVAMMRSHGAYARGDNLWEALHWLTALEESAHISLLRGGRGLD